MEVSIFKSTSHVKEPVDVKLNSVLSTFRTKDNHDIQGIRDLRGQAFDEKKKALPVVCFGGTFSQRNKEGLKKASGLMILDFDGKDISELKDLEQRLKADEYIYSAFISTSGRGYKALVRIPEVTGDEDYKKYYFSFMQRYPEMDTSGKDISRCCYYTYDPELFVNPDANIWEEVYVEKEEPVKFNKERFEHTDYSTANKVLNIIRYAQIGQRHDKILKASILMGGYVAGGSIDYDEAKRLLEQEAYKVDPTDYKINQKAVYDGLERGLQKPITDTLELEKETVELKFGKIYYTAFDKKDEIDEQFKNGLQRGYEVGFDDAAEHMSIKPGATTYIYGAPYCGKTQVWFEFLMNMSIQYGMKHCIFSPETGKATDIFIELISIHAEKDFYNTYRNQMTSEQMDRSRQFCDRHFIVVDPEDKVLTVDDFFEYVDICERVYNTKIHTATIDPWNEIRHDFKDHNNRQDQYLEWVLGAVRENARKNERHNCVITHVQDQKQIKDKDTDIWFYPPATFREVAGGQAWSRKGMQMLSIYRPQFGLKDEHGINYDENQTVVIVQKSKPKGIGKTGKFNLYYNPKRHRYYEGNGKYGHPIISDIETLENSYSKYDKDIPF